MRARTAPLLITLAAAFLLAGCSGSGGSETTAADAGAVSAAIPVEAGAPGVSGEMAVTDKAAQAPSTVTTERQVIRTGYDPTAALHLPPLADQHPATLGLLAALAALSDAVYTATVADVGRELPIEITSSSSSASASSSGRAATAAAVATARLLHFRPAGGHHHGRHDHRHPRSPLDDLVSDDDEDDEDGGEEDLESPQQWGLWRLRLPHGGSSGGGGGGEQLECLVVAFRGTASPADVLIDAAIALEALAPLGAYSSSRSDEGNGRQRGSANESSSSSSSSDGDDDEREEREERDAGAAKRRWSSPDPPPPPLHAHHGFLTGTRRHLRSILRLMSCHGGARGGGNGNGKGTSSPAPASSGDFSVPVFFTGHSLGGGYAAAAALDLLSSGSAKRVFGAASARAAETEARQHEQQQEQQRRRRQTPSAAPPPPSPPLPLLRGGVVTFGAPPVFHCPPGHADRAHARLDELMEAAGLAAKRIEDENGENGENDSNAPLFFLPRFSFLNVVTAGDPVPRLLGTGFSGVARLVASAVPSVDAVRAAAEAYRPLGTLLFDLSGAVSAGAPSSAAGAASGTTSPDIGTW